MNEKKLGAPAYLKSASKGFEDAIEYFGGTKKLADALGISSSQVQKLRIGKHKIRLCHACKIEQLTGGKIKAADLNK